MCLVHRSEGEERETWMTRDSLSGEELTELEVTPKRLQFEGHSLCQLRGEISICS